MQKPKEKPWRLGHLFEFIENEDLLHNDHFTIESSSYSITAVNSGDFNSFKGEQQCIDGFPLM